LPFIFRAELMHFIFRHKYALLPDELPLKLTFTVPSFKRVIAIRADLCNFAKQPLQVLSKTGIFWYNNKNNKRMNLHQFNQFKCSLQAFLEKRLIFAKIDKPSGTESKEKETEKKGGIPIDTEPDTEEKKKNEEEAKKKKAEEVKKRAEEEAKRKKTEDEARKKAEQERLRQAGIEAKKKVSEAETKIIAEHGGAVYEMSQMPGNNDKGYKNTVYINKPPNPEKFVDKSGKPIPPKIIYFFHGKEGEIESDEAKIIKRVEEMRARGENVILVMPQDNKGGWKDLDHKDALRDMQRLTEEVTGVKGITDISIITRREGKEAAKKVMDRLREAAVSDPQAKVLLDNLSGRITEMEEEKEDEPRIPERAPDALSGKEFMAKYKECKTPEEKTRLVMEQLAKGNVPPHYRTFETITVEKEGHRMQFRAAKHGFCFGTDSDYVEIPLDGPTSKAVADALGCTLPAKWHVDAIDAWGRQHGSYVRFFGQQDFAGELGLDPKVVHGDRMASPEFIEKRNEKVREWARQNGVSPDRLTFGDGKDVVLPEPGVTPNGRLEIYGGIDFTGHRVQGLSGGVHEAAYYDYSHRIRLIADTVTVDGREMRMEDAMKDPDIARTFGYAARDITAAYPYDAQMQRYVADIRAHQTSRPQSAPASNPDSASAIIADNATVAPAEPAPAPTASIPDTEPPPPTPPSYTPVVYRPGSAYGPSVPQAQPSSSSQEAPAEQSAPAAQEQQPQPEAAPLNIERKFSGKFFILGDSLSDGFIPKMKGVNLKHVLPEGRKSAVGMTTTEMLSAFKSKILYTDVQGANLIILGGTNDIFMPDSLEKIKANLSEIYKLGKLKGMNVMGATLPPVGDSEYARYWAKKTNTPYERYNQELISRWETLNEWIRSQKGLKDSSDAQIGPDEVIDFSAILEDPHSPGRLKPENRGQGGIHLRDYSPMANLIKQYIAEPGEAGTESGKEKTPPAETAAKKDEKAPEEGKPEGKKEWRPVRNWRTVADLASTKQREWIGKKPVGHTEIYTDPVTGKEFQLRVGAHQVKEATGYTVDSDKYNDAKNRGFPLSEAGKSYLYAVEVWEKNPDYDEPKPESGTATA
jgi:hypothetical protein